MVGVGVGGNVSEQSDSFYTRISVSSASPGFTLFVLPVHAVHTVLTSVVVTLKYNIKPVI